MGKWMRWMALGLGLGWTLQAAAELVFFENDDFNGRSFVVNQPADDFVNFGFNDRASSVRVRNGTWQVCSDANFRGQCATLTPGDYRSLAAFGLNDRISSARPVGGPVPEPAPGPRGRITLFDFANFDGRGETVEADVYDLSSRRYNDRAHSAIVDAGTWQVCEHADFRGLCMTLPPGRYADLGALDGKVSSARLLGIAPPTTPPPPVGRPGPERGGARAILFGQRGFQGRSLVLEDPVVRNFEDFGFNDRASSLRVERGYWMFCSDANFEGECRTFGPGDYASLPPELQNRVSSARRISNRYPYREEPNWRQ